MTQKADLALSILCFIILLDTNEDQNVQKTLFLTEDMNAVTEPINSSGVYFGIQS